METTDCYLLCIIQLIPTKTAMVYSEVPYSQGYQGQYELGQIGAQEK